MDSTSQTTTSSNIFNKALTTSPLVEVQFIVHAPVEKVWKAWSQPELARQWWGPKGFSCPEAKINFKVGGNYLLAMKFPNGDIQYSTGLYEQIVPYEKIAMTDHFCDKDGNLISAKEAGMNATFADPCYVNVEFERIGEHATQLRLTHEGIPAEMHDDCVQGWTSSLGKLDHLLSRN